MSKVSLFVNKNHNFRIKVIPGNNFTNPTVIDMNLENAICYTEYLSSQINDKDLQRISLNPSVDISKESAIGLYEHLSNFIDFILTGFIGINPFKDKINSESN